MTFFVCDHTTPSLMPLGPVHCHFPYEETGLENRSNLSIVSDPALPLSPLSLALSVPILQNKIRLGTI